MLLKNFQKFLFNSQSLSNYSKCSKSSRDFLKLPETSRIIVIMPKTSQYYEESYQENKKNLLKTVQNFLKNTRSLYNFLKLLEVSKIIVVMPKTGYYCGNAWDLPKSRKVFPNCQLKTLQNFFGIKNMPEVSQNSLKQRFQKKKRNITKNCSEII